MQSTTHPPDGVVLAIDVGATKMAACLVGGNGRIHQRAMAMTHAGATVAEDVWAPLAALVDRLVDAADGQRLLGIGIGSAGPVDPVRGTVSPVNISAWRDFPLVERLAARVPPGLPIRLAGDGVCAAAGEHWRGAGRGVDDLLVMVVSTGVGGGLVQGGRLVTGPSGNAGHVGHMVVDMGGEPCPCGGHGCVEALASGPSMVRWAVRQGWRAATADPGAVELAAAARAGHQVARIAFERAGAAIAAGAVSVAALCDLTHVVLGGGVSQAADLLLPPLSAAIARYARLGFLRDLTVLPAGLGVNAGLVGAAAMVFAPNTYPVPYRSVAPAQGSSGYPARG
ncbi:MAG TPA: ROK family protein [Pilimelia sp.]|nr:ROK family protein [Pilimelia sp.]